MGITKDLADFVLRTNYSEFDQTLIDKTKEAFLEWVGVVIAGTRQKAGQIFLDYIRRVPGKGKCSIIGTTVKTNETDAASAMGLLSHIHDYDDIYWPMIGHPSATICPAIFALGEKHFISGSEAIEAYVASFEIDALVGAATAEYHYFQGWHTTSTVGVFGSTAAGAKILHLNSQKIRRAFGIAASQASGLRQNFGTMTKSLHPGNAAAAGVRSVLLADMGFTANENIIEADQGFANVFCGSNHSELTKLQRAVQNRKVWALISPGRTSKSYPVCGTSAVAVECAMNLKSTHHIDAKDILRVECYIRPEIRKIVIVDGPKNGLEGKYCVTYCIAVALIDGCVGLDQFTDERIVKRDVQDLLQKIHLVDHDFKTRDETMIRIHTRKGTYTANLTFPKGSPENPMSHQEIIDKFKACTRESISSYRANTIIEHIMDLENHPDIREIVRVCRIRSCV